MDEGAVGAAPPRCLGPCFSGCLVGTKRGIGGITMECLGPCFSGCLVGTKVSRG